MSDREVLYLIWIKISIGASCACFAGLNLTHTGSLYYREVALEPATDLGRLHRNLQQCLEGIVEAGLGHRLHQKPRVGSIGARK